MEENPYSKLLAAVRPDKGSGTGLVMGEVLSWPTEQAPGRPHKVLAGGNAQERDALLRAEALGEHGLKAGDTVLLLPIEEAQRYIILCQVVAV